jgi:hypothetical protein
MSDQVPRLAAMAEASCSLDDSLVSSSMYSQIRLGH